MMHLNPYMMHDRAKHQFDDAEDHDDRRNEWIRNKADELAEEFPETVMEFYRTSTGFSPYKVGLDSDEAQDAYAAFIDAVCLTKATQLYSDAEFLGEVA